MLNDTDLDALLAGRHADPFSRLGLHADETGRLWVRVLLPFRLDHINVYLIEDGSGWAVLDTGIGNDRTRVVTVSQFYSSEERDGMLASGMEEGMNQSYAALDRVLAALV